MAVKPKPVELKPGINCPRCGKHVETTVKQFSHYSSDQKVRMEPCGHLIRAKDGQPIGGSKS